MTLDLPERYKTELLAILRRLAPQWDALAYGSRLTADHHEGSDLDIVLRHPSEPSARFPAIGPLREALGESNIPILIDVHDWASLPAAFQAEIEKRHVKL